MKTLGAGIVSMLIATMAFAMPAGAAGPGDTFMTGYLETPAGNIPGGESGWSNDQGTASPTSADGRYVAFISNANRMAPGADPDSANVFRKDRVTGEVVLVSRASGAETPGPSADSYTPRISADGNLIAFLTNAPLSPGDADGDTDAYVRDVSAGTTTLATPGTMEFVAAMDLSADGAYVAFSTKSELVAGDSNGNYDVYRRKLSDGTTELISRVPATPTAGNDNSHDPSISGDGRFVAFSSTSTDLAPGFIEGNSTYDSDVYVRDVTGAATSLASNRFDSASIGGNGESYSPDLAGTPANLNEVRVAYSSRATNVAAGGVDADGDTSIYLKSFAALPSTLISQSTAGVNADSRAHDPSVSDDATKVVFSSDAGNLGAGDNYYGTYVRNVTDGTTALTSKRNDYAIQGSLSGDGSLTTWVEAGDAEAGEPGIIAVFSRTLPGGTVEFTSRPAGNAPFLTTAAGVNRESEPQRSISADGRYQVFASGSTRLPDGAGDIESQRVYRRDLKTGEIVLVSRASGANGEPSKYASRPSISADGNRVAFITTGRFDPADADDNTAAYVRDVKASTTTLASRADGAAGAVANDNVGSTSLSADGNRVGFVTSAANLEGGGANSQVYVRDLSTSATILVSKNGAVKGNGNSESPSLDRDGSKVAFISQASDLHPDDADTQSDVYVKDLSSDAITLASRRPGLSGDPADSYAYSVSISDDGSTVAFTTSDEQTVPGSGTWPVGVQQVIARKLDTGENTLVSGSSSGVAGDDGGGVPTLSADGSVAAFSSYSTNLLTGHGGNNHESVFVKDLATGSVSGPPPFGRAGAYPGQGSHAPSISADGRCLSFVANGHNTISGDASDIVTTYVYVASGSCEDPRNQVIEPGPAPKLSKVSLKPKRFAVGKKPTAKVAAKKRRKVAKGTKVRFTIDLKATVAVVIQKRSVGRKVGGKCRKTKKHNRSKKKCARFDTVGKIQRKNLAAGSRKIAFSGRIGKKKLKPGKYRAAVRASNQNGTSKTVNRPFTVVKG